MPPRTRQITLSNNIELSTPLLIPSMSSRATGPIRTQRSPSGESELTACSIVHSQSLIEGIEESLLISAYDIHHDFLEDRSAFQCGFSNSRYAGPLLFIDSGWYEKGGSSPDMQFGENQYKSRKWEELDYRHTINTLDDDIRPIVVSWDHFGSYPEQIRAGQDFFGDRNTLASIMLLKPPNNSGLHDLMKLSGRDFANLRAFDVIGVTEKEIGNSLLDRLVNITQLRRQLDEAGVESPIHVLGGLDPLYTPLYFAAGGELFDGLGWLRYTYRDGVAMHRDTAVILDRLITRGWASARVSVCLRNLDELRRLAEDLRVFAHQNCDWRKFHRADALEPIFNALKARLGA